MGDERGGSRKSDVSFIELGDGDGDGGCRLIGKKRVWESGIRRILALLITLSGLCQENTLMVGIMLGAKRVYKGGHARDLRCGGRRSKLRISVSEMVVNGDKMKNEHV